MLGIVIDDLFDRKLKKKTSKTRTVSEQLDEDIIKLTSVRRKTLNPKWNEIFILKVNDVMKETLHLDIWDHDEDTAFLDKENKITQIKGVAGVGRFLKQVVQSSKKCAGGSMDDFLGFVEVPIKDIPSGGVDKWFPLQARSAKSKTSGDCHLVLRLVGVQSDNGIRKESSKTSSSSSVSYSVFLKSFVVYDGDHAGDDVFGSGEISRFAQWVLHQYAIQNNISHLQKAISEWEVYSWYHQTRSLKYSFLEKLLSSINNKWKSGELSSADEEMFHQSLDSFVEFCLRLISNHRSLYPATNSMKLRRCANMLNCIKSIQSLPNYCARRGNDIRDEILNTVKVSAEKWYTLQFAWLEPKDQTQASAILSLVSLSEVIVCDLLKAIKFYSKIFNEVGVDYFLTTYMSLERLLASDMRQSIAKMDVKKLQVEVGDGDLGTKLFSLYLAAREIIEYRKYLTISENKEFAFDNSHVWFKKFIDYWFRVAHQKALARITKAVEIDQTVAIDSSVQYSTSAVDVTCCFYQLCEFWKRLQWPNATESYLFVLKISDDICEAARHYAEELGNKLKANNYYNDNPSYFGVSESLCITLNNLAYTQQWLKELDTHLDWHSVIRDMRLAHDNETATKSELTLRQLSENTQEVLFNKMDEMIDHIVMKMSIDLKRFISELVSSNEDIEIADAMDPLLAYLEKSLKTFYETLVRPVFDRTLPNLWNGLVTIVVDTIKHDKGRSPIFYQRMNQVVKVLTDFFCVDGIGIPRENMITDELKELLDDLGIRQLTSERLIEEYYAEKMIEMLEKPRDLGELALRMFYDSRNEKLHIELLNGRNLPALDSNGYSDPYVRLTLAPRHLFPMATVERTDVQWKTLFPLFDAKFQYSVSAESCKQHGAHVQLTVIDYDVLTDDIAGQVFASLNHVPGLETEIPATFSGIEQVLVPVIHPTPEGKYFEILKARSDELAMKFVKERQDIYQKLSPIRNKAKGKGS
ncbi:BAI1-associated protein 3-like isoform X2 [Xenia sp. Carnegie-2017]|nr:BAI1-associated protein 3-like isoform X2 [Xenia sp. Carnegie-2017]